MTEIISKNLTPEEIADRKAYSADDYNREYSLVEADRLAAYRDESDPIFFNYQRSEDGATKQAWLDKVAEIKERHPYPVKQ